MPPLSSHLLFVHFISHEKSWVNREQGICNIIDICGFAAPHLFSLLEKAHYLFRGFTLVWLSVIWKADQPEDSIPLTTAINSQCFSRKDILFLQVLPVCVDMFLELPCHFSPHGERQLEDKTTWRKARDKHPLNPEVILRVPETRHDWSPVDLF